MWHGYGRSLIIAAVGLVWVSAGALWQPQIQIDTPKGSPNTLSVHFRGAKTAGVGLEVDGQIVASRSLPNLQASSLSFQLDATQLAPGYHQVKIYLYDAQGRVIGSASQRVEIQPDPAAPISILIPPYGTTVSGVVEVQVQVSESSRKPYISIFVDNKFRTLRNFPPYTYTWDTTKESNGWHVIEAWSFDESQTTQKAAPVRVFVNNPGGFTQRVTEPPGEPVISPHPASPPLVNQQGPQGVRPGPNMVDAPHNQIPVPPAANAGQTPEKQPQTKPTPPSANLQRATPVKPPPTPQPRPTAPGSEAQLTKAPAEKPVGKTATPRSPFSIARLTGQKLDVPELAVNPNPAVNMRPTTATKPWVPILAGTRLPNTVRTFDVVFDSTILTFDVQPRVQDGIPLAPFRHIFEHTGGTLEWYSQTQTVVARRADGSITLQISSPTATVNGNKVPMELAPFIISGRTFVPLSFVREALEVNVYYDPNSGDLIINSKE